MSNPFSNKRRKFECVDLVVTGSAQIEGLVIPDPIIDFTNTEIDCRSLRAMGLNGTGIVSAVDNVNAPLVKATSMVSTPRIDIMGNTSTTSTPTQTPSAWEDAYISMQNVDINMYNDETPVEDKACTLTLPNGQLVTITSPPFAYATTVTFDPNHMPTLKSGNHQNYIGEWHESGRGPDPSSGKVTNETKFRNMFLKDFISFPGGRPYGGRFDQPVENVERRNGGVSKALLHPAATPTDIDVERFYYPHILFDEMAQHMGSNDIPDRFDIQTFDIGNYKWIGTFEYNNDLINQQQKGGLQLNVPINGQISFHTQGTYDIPTAYVGGSSANGGFSNFTYGLHPGDDNKFDLGMRSANGTIVRQTPRWRRGYFSDFVSVKGAQAPYPESYMNSYEVSTRLLKCGGNTEYPAAIQPVADGIYDIGYNGVVGVNQMRFRDCFLVGQCSASAFVKIGNSNDISVLGDASTGNLTVGGNLLPDSTAGNRDLGLTGKRFRDLWLGRNAGIGGTLSVTGAATTGPLTTTSTITTGGGIIPSADNAMQNGLAGLRWSEVNTVGLNATTATVTGATATGPLTVNGNVLPNATGVRDIGTTALRFRDLNLSGTVNANAINVTNSQGTIRNSVVGAPSNNLILRWDAVGNPGGAAGVMTEVAGEVLSFGINCPQVEGTRNNTRAGGICRIDTRTVNPVFAVISYPPGATDAGFQLPLSVGLGTGGGVTVQNTLAAGAITSGGTLTVTGAAATGPLTVNGDLVPSTFATRNLGLNSMRWAGVYPTFIDCSGSGTFQGGITISQPSVSVGLSVTTNNVKDIGTSALRFRDLWLAGAANITGSLAAGTTTVSGNLVPDSTGGNRNLGLTGQRWAIAYITDVLSTTISASGSVSAASYSAPGPINLTKDTAITGALTISDTLTVAGNVNALNFQAVSNVGCNNLFANTLITPYANNVVDIGTIGTRFKDLFLINAPNVSSDRNTKQDIADIDDAYLRAWDNVQLKQFRYIDQPAKLRIGVIAQEVDAAFAAQGMDLRNTSLGRFDTYDTRDKNGNIIGQTSQWSMSPTDCLFLECAHLRKRVATLESAFAQAIQLFEARLVALEGTAPP